MADKSMSGYKVKVSEFINNYLEETNKSNKEFGELFGVDESTVRRWRKSQGALDINQLGILADYLNISVDQIMGRLNENSLSDIQRERLRKLEANESLADIVDKYFEGK